MNIDVLIFHCFAPIRRRFLLCLENPIVFVRPPPLADVHVRCFAIAVVADSERALVLGSHVVFLVNQLLLSSLVAFLLEDGVFYHELFQVDLQVLLIPDQSLDRGVHHGEICVVHGVQSRLERFFVSIRSLKIHQIFHRQLRRHKLSSIIIPGARRQCIIFQFSALD